MTIILFVIILVILIVVHEFGHFSAAKLFGVRVDEFGIGFPPKVFAKKWGETLYSINIFPIGGFVKIFGEDMDAVEEGVDWSRSFGAQKKYKQSIILLAGIVGNIVFAWFLFVIGFTIGMPIAIDESTVGTITDRKVIVLDTLPNSPAMKAGLMANDQLVEIRSPKGGVATGTADKLTSFIRGNQGQSLTLLYIRNGEDKVATATPIVGITNPDSKDAAIGVSLGESGVVHLPIHQAILKAATFTAEMCYLVFMGIITLLSGLFTFSADLGTVSGPVGIAGLVGQASALGFSYLLAFTALISINLAIVNLIPFPALDGGRLLFVVIEAVTRRKMNQKIAQWMNIIGFALLILLMIAVTAQDIFRLL